MDSRGCWMLVALAPAGLIPAEAFHQLGETQGAYVSQPRSPTEPGGSGSKPQGAVIGPGAVGSGPPVKSH